MRKPRLLRLLAVAARAEAIIWRRTARGYVWRAVLGTLAVMAGGLLLLSLHAALWIALARFLGPVGGAVTVAAVDLALCLGLGWLAAQRLENPIARDASAVRNDALRESQSMLNPFRKLPRQPDNVPMPRGRHVRVYPPLRVPEKR